ncbi:Sorting nexin-16 [Cucurbita argyrosperma subsp. argyrosperma]|nr:Sorting nexin-16 [Cucurbita argyrosperma subsp. argyrosperma]
MKAMATVQDLIEEFKLRTVWWTLCIFSISYFLTHTSKSMWLNAPLAILLVSALRILFNEVEFRRKVRPVQQQTYLSHLEKKQLSVNDLRLSSAIPPPRWKRKLDSPIVEAAMKDFIDKILKDFVVDLWYSEITPDKEFPEQIHALIMDALGEIAVRVKKINLVDLLTRDVVDLVGDHLDLFRRNQAAIGIDVMGTLSSKERDERLKHHLMASKELHPALLSPESEYKVLQRLMSGVLTSVLRPRETQCPVVRSIARELLTCLVMQPLMNFASPGHINEVIECIVLATKAENDSVIGSQQSTYSSDQDKDHSSTAGFVHDDDLDKSKHSSLNPGNGSELAKIDNQQERSSGYMFQEEPLQLRHGDWGRALNAATQRRTEVLMPENLENMWTKGRNYRKKENKIIKVGDFDPMVTKKDSGISSMQLAATMRDEVLNDKHHASIGPEEMAIVRKTLERHSDLILTSKPGDENKIGFQISRDFQKDLSIDGKFIAKKLRGVDNLTPASATKNQLKRSNSTSALETEVSVEKTSTVEGGRSIISDFSGPNFGKHSEEHLSKSVSDMVAQKEGLLVPKLRSRVMGAYFEKLGSKSFAVYSIAVTDTNKRTWFVKRRYRNFERLHRHLKDIPNYTLHLPPKRIFSSSTEDAFVHQRCIQLDKYLQELLSIANLAEQHEVWDFLSVSSKNYSFGKSSSVMRTLAVNVDDAVDDIVRQFKGVSDGFMRKVVGSTSPSDEACALSNYEQKFSFNSADLRKHVSAQYNLEVANNISDEESERIGSQNHDVSGWHSDNELNSKSFPPRVIKRGRELDKVVDKKNDLELRSGASLGGHSPTLHNMEDPEGMPPEWTPPNVSVPLLNLVDKIFQLNRRGWLRRQVLWISKQILQLIMEDAIDDWIVRQIHWLRREDIIAQGIRWVQDVLWPNGTFFIQLRNAQSEDDSESITSRTDGSKIPKPGSFELQLEAARRASDVKKMLLGGAPTPLVSLIGHKQYKRCAKDIYYFTQSTICVKQLGYGLLELLLVSIFPELQSLVLEVHGKSDISQAVK